jgi:hypothetical protein
MAWMAIFLLGTAIFAWLELRSDNGSAMVWFFLTGLWSAACGIGYTVHHWFIVERVTNSSSR